MNNDSAPTCFIMMPITTPAELQNIYAVKADHFENILNYLIEPAVIQAGYRPIYPSVTGSLLIHSEIIKRIIQADMAVADMSSLNPNVFFEMGIRAALNKPLCIICDEKTKSIPFDTKILGCHTYTSSISIESIKNEVNKIANHIIETEIKGHGENSMWHSLSADSFFVSNAKPRGNILQNIENEIRKIKNIQMIPSAHSPKQQLAKVTAIDVFGKLSDMAADAGYFIDLEKYSDYRILVRASKHRSIPKKMQDMMKTCGKRYGYKIIFT